MGRYYHCLEDFCHRNAGWCPPPRRQFLVELDCLTPKRRTICLSMSFWRPSSYNDKGYCTYHGCNGSSDHHCKCDYGDVVFIHHLTPHEVVVAAIRKLGLHPDRFMSNNFGFRLIHGTRQLGHTDAVPEAPDVVKLSMVGLVGGKGGFGAALRAMAKQAGDKKTTDFGACRDLQGRRLRHVNDEIRLRKWKEERDRADQSGGNMSTTWDEDTPTGIEAWHLGAPSWADGIKKKSTAKVPRKSWMCKDWVMARMERNAPDGAPPWWGCPRGRNCNFAHGEEELRGQGASQALIMKKDIERLEIRKSLDDYVSGSIIKETQENMSDAVAQGMATAKLGKWRKIEDNGNQHQRKAVALPVGVDGSTDPSLVATSWPGCSWLRVVSGEARSTPDGHLLGISSFATIVVTEPSAVCSGCWYLEFTLKSSTGRVQVGWADSMMFQPDSITGDGVGDDLRSWAFDGSNNPSRAWNGEEDEDKAKEYGRPWIASDVIGCLFDMDKHEISFHINGDLLGVAFRDVPHSEGGKGYLAAISLEDGEMVTVNIGTSGASPLLFGPPEGYKPLGEAPSQPVSVGIWGEDSSKSPGMTERPSENAAVTGQVIEEEDLNSNPQGPIDLDRFDSPSDLIDCGLIRLRDELKRRGCKSGGTLYDRAARLYSLKGLELSQYPP